MYSLNDNTQIMAEHLAEHLVQLPNITLATYGIAKLRLDHGESSFHIGPLVIVCLETPPDYT